MKWLPVYMTILTLVTEGTLGSQNLEELFEGGQVQPEECFGDRCLVYTKRREIGSDTAVDEALPKQTGRWELFCPCDTEYTSKYLGANHYPRYLLVAQCKSRNCITSLSRCTLLHYEVYVLKRRDPTQIERYSEEGPIPDSLRLEWQMKAIKIPVACAIA